MWRLATIFALPTLCSTCAFCHRCCVLRCIMFVSFTRAPRRYGSHRRYLCAVAATVVCFGIRHCRIQPSSAASAATLPVVLQACIQHVGVQSHCPAVLQAQRLRLLAVSSLNMLLLQKLGRGWGAQSASRRNSVAILLWLLKRSGSGIVASCLDCAIQTRVASVFCRR